MVPHNAPTRLVALVAILLIASSGCAGNDTTQTTTAPDVSTTLSALPSDTAGSAENWTAEAANPPFGATSGETNVLVQDVVPWDGGFLAIGTESQPVPLPSDLPPEIVELFSEEVRELFPEGLPSQDEAIEILQDAGLFDEVMAVLSDHPEASDALSTDPLPRLLVAAWSADGLDWERAALHQPTDIAEVSSYSTRGDRLTVVGPIGRLDGIVPITLEVATTTDLVNWETTEFIVTQDSTGNPVDITSYAHPWEVAANDTGWIVQVAVDPPSFPTTVQTWTGTWSGAPTLGSADDHPSQIIATSAGFVEVDDEISFSPDGIDWNPVRPPDEDFRVDGMAPLNEGAVMIGGSPGRDTAVYVVDATASDWHRVELSADVGELVYLMPSMSPAFFKYGTDGLDSWIIATPDGERWVVEPYERTIESAFPMLAATNGEYVLTGEIPAPFSEGVAVWQRWNLLD